MTIPRVLLAAVALTATLGCATAHAAVIPGLFNTGVDDAGLALVGGHGVLDPHYVIVASTTPGLAGQHAVTFHHPAYVPNDADSRWISVSPTGGPGSNVTTYRLTFSLAGLDAATAQINGFLAVDNSLSIFLNGAATAAGAAGFGGLQAFSLNSGFVAGENTLDFRVTDQGEPTAFRVDGLTGTADVLPPPPTGAVPEPATWAMMIIGFTGVGALMRRRQGQVFA